MIKNSSEIKSCLKFIDYKVEALEFDLNKTFDADAVDVDFNIESNVDILEKKQAAVRLELKIFPEAEKNNYPFTMKLVLVGLFEIVNYDISEGMYIFEKNAIAILFPYIRSLVSTITANVNVPPLILPPINVVSFLESRKHAENKLY